MPKSIPCLLLSAGLLLAANVARGQAAPESDVLDEVIVDHHGTTLNHPIRISIPEDPTEGGPFTFTVPALTIDFHEPGGVTGQPTISDRLHLDPFTVTVTSDRDPGGLPQRTSAKFIPAEAVEKFLPLSIFVHSDGNNPNAPPGGESDHLGISLGGFSGSAGSVFLDLAIPEPTAEGAPEPAVPFDILPQSYDIADAGVPGTNSLISDYFDHGPIRGFFISSDNPLDYDPALIVDGIVVEDGFASNPFYGGDLRYDVRFASDAEVPEPGTIVLLGLGFAGLGFAYRARFVTSARQRRRRD